MMISALTARVAGVLKSMAVPLSNAELSQLKMPSFTEKFVLMLPAVDAIAKGS